MRGLIAFISIFGLYGASARAGEVLKLKTGEWTSQKVTESLSMVPLAQQQMGSYRQWIVQFPTRVEATDLERLARFEVKILRYIPEDAFLVEARASQIQNLKSRWGRVQTVVPYLAVMKVSPDFGPQNVFNSQSQIEVMLRMLPGHNVEAVRGQLHSEKIRFSYVKDDVALIQLARGDLEVLAAQGGVEWLEPYVPMTLHYLEAHGGPRGLLGGAPTDQDPAATPTPSLVKGDYSDLSGYESGTRVMNFEAAWSRGLSGFGQLVSMADTGLDSGDLSTLFGDFSSVTKGYAFGMFSDSWMDPMGHGTHVAGSVMGKGLASLGSIRGGAFGAQMIAEGMWSDMLSNITVPPQLNGLFNQAYQEGARIHTNSWGSPQNLGAYDNFSAQVDAYIWDHPDFLILFAAGNEGKDGDKDGRIDSGSVSSPGTAKNALTVGASENLVLVGGIQKKLGELAGGEPWSVEPLASDRLSDNPNGIAAFSSRGPTADNRLKPDVVAPGTNILSNCSHVPGASNLWGNYNPDYCYSGGTSMSTPLTAGAAVVVRQFLIERLHLNKPSAASIKGVLMHTADDLFPGQYGQVGKASGQEILNPGPNNDQGFGRVNMDAATNDTLQVIQDDQGVGQGEEHSYKVNLPPTAQNLKVTLVYSDAPAAASAAKALVNDLDLMVAVSSTAVKANNRVNNSEQLIVKGIAGSEAQIWVSGFNVPQGKQGRQPFSLVVSFQ